MKPKVGRGILLIINVVKSWAFTTSTETEVFRISHLSPASGENLRAVVAQGFYDEGDTPNIFNPKIIFSREESEIFTLYFPAGISSHSIGIKRLDKAEMSWI